jgi:hypothetical protein
MCNAMNNQSIIQSTPVIFSFRSSITDVVTTVGKVRTTNAGRRSRVPIVYWSHMDCLIQEVKEGIDCIVRCIYAALNILCIGCSVAKSVKSFMVTASLGYLKCNGYIKK